MLSLPKDSISYQAPRGIQGCSTTRFIPHTEPRVQAPCSLDSELAERTQIFSQGKFHPWKAHLFQATSASFPAEAAVTQSLARHKSKALPKRREPFLPPATSLTPFRPGLFPGSPLTKTTNTKLTDEQQENRTRIPSGKPGMRTLPGAEQNALKGPEPRGGCGTTDRCHSPERAPLCEHADAGVQPSS